MINIKAFLGLTNYISELDQFLTGFDHKHTNLTHSQRKEKEKYNRIFQLRDNPLANQSEQTEKFWDKF
jgi:succinate dehydrogenase flavin-adding protein (antitoxin of CptAB toxin-antitoxin module)